MCDYCFAVWTYTHSLSLSCRSVRAPLGNFTEDNALDEWRYDCSQLHGDIFFCPRLQFIIWNCDTDLQRWLTAERRIAFCFDKKDVIKKKRKKGETAKNRMFGRVWEMGYNSELVKLTANGCWSLLHFATVWLSSHVHIIKITRLSLWSRICIWSSFVSRLFTMLITEQWQIGRRYPQL